MTSAKQFILLKIQLLSILTVISFTSANFEAIFGLLIISSNILVDQERLVN